MTNPTKRGNLTVLSKAMEAKNKDLRRKILDGTRSMLLDQGFADVSMRKIAKKVGCSATSIYLYFDNKDVLLHALIEEGFEKMLQEFHNALRTTESNVRKLYKVMNSYVRFALENPEYYEVMFSLRPKQMMRFPAQKFRRAKKGIEIIADLIKEISIDYGKVPSEDPYVAAWCMWSSMHGAVTLMLSQRLDIKINTDVFISMMIEKSVGSTLPYVSHSEIQTIQKSMPIPKPSMAVGMNGA